MNGREKTERWIETWKVRDDGGNPHRPHGVWTTAALLMVYVTFDRHRRVGQKAIYFFTRSLQILADLKAGQEPVYGSREGNRHGATGAGYLFRPLGGGPDDPSPDSLMLRTHRGAWTFVDRIEPIAERGRDDSERAVEVVAGQLSARGLRPRPATVPEQKAGIDLVAADERRRYGTVHLSIVVKSRTRASEYDALFLQISETNADRRHV